MTSNALGPGFLTDDASGASRDVTTGGVLLAVDDSLRSPWLPTLAEAVAADRNGDLLVAKVVSIPEQTPPSMSGSILHRHRDPLEESFNTVTENGTTTSVEGVVRVGTGSVPVIAGAAMDHGASTIVLGTGDRSRSRFPGRRSDAERVRARTSCRVVVADDSHRTTDLSSILVPVAGGPHSGAAVEVARAVASRYDAWIELLHVLEPNAGSNRRTRARGLLESTGGRLDGEQWDTWLLEAEDVAEAIVEQSTYYDATVLGAPRKSRLRRFVFGSTTSAVEDRAESAVLTVWAERETTGRLGEWFGGGR